jgi:hypothetical protein
MSEHPSSELLAQYNLRILPSDIFLKVHRHILACSECDEKCTRPERLGKDYAALHSALLSAPAEETPYHLSAAEAETYIKNELGEIDLEIAESHLELCPECRESVRRLRNVPGRSTAVEAGASAREAAERPRSFGWFSLSWIGWLRPGHVVTLFACLFLILVALAIFRTKMDERADTAANASQAESNGNGNPASESARANFNGPAASESRNGNNVEESPKPTVERGVPAPEAQIVRVINDNGRRIILDAKGNLSGLEDLPTGIRREIKEMLITGKVHMPPRPAEFDDESATLLDESSDDGLPFRLLSPVSKVVPDNQPAFSWQPLSGAQSYIVTVTDAQLNPVSTSEPLKSTVWKIPTSLKYGGTYSWQVTAIRDGKRITSPVLPAPQARFKIIAYDDLRELRRARNAYANSHLTLAALYIRLGLFDEAEKELKTLVRSNPQSSVARSLLRSLRR